MRMFKIVGNWMRGIYAMGFGGFWLGLAYYFSSLGEFGPGKPTILGLLLLGSLVFGGGLIVFVRGMLFAAQRAPLPKEAAGWRDNGERAASDTSFDPDEAIARYLQRRPASAEPPAQETVADVPARPTFGRKQV